MAKKCCDGDSVSIEANASSSSCCPGTGLNPCGTTQAGCLTPVSDCCTPTRSFSPSCRPSSMCPEDNRQVVYVEKLVGAFRNVGAFAMPACDAKLRVQFDRVGDVPIGAWMWAFGIGSLEIVGFNPLTGEIELQNNCPQDSCTGASQAAPGTPIPACTVWMLMVPTCAGSNQGSAITFPYLNSGFVAPESGDCIDIAVTNVNGLSVNKNVTIMTGTYRVSAILSATLITICNDGSGLTPGTVVEYKDAAGNLLVPITQLDSNPCLADTVLSGKILVCKNSVQQPLVGIESGQVPVYDDATGEWNARTIGLPTLDCTELTVALTLDPDQPSGTSYLIIVSSTAAFTAGDTVTIGATSFTIDTIDDATHLHATPNDDPTAVQTYPAGSALCSGGCCEILEERITEVINGEFIWAGDSSGPANQYNLVLPDFTAYSNGQLIGFRSHQTSTNAAFINVNGIGAIPVVFRTGSVAYPAAAISTGNLIFGIVENDRFTVIGPTGNLVRGWSPTVAVNGTGVVSNIQLVVCDYTSLDPYCYFRLAVYFDLASAGGGSGTDRIYVANPMPSEGGAAETGCNFPAQLQAGGVNEVGFWHTDGSSIVGRRLNGSEFPDGATKLHVNGHFKLTI